MKKLSLEKLNENMLGMEVRLDAKIEDLAVATKQTFNQHEERFDAIDLRFDQIDKRFDRVENAVLENKSAIDQIKDTLIVMMQKMDAEFAAATLQRQRFLDKFENHDNRIERLESFHSTA